MRQGLSLAYLDFSKNYRVAHAVEMMNGNLPLVFGLIAMNFAGCNIPVPLAEQQKLYHLFVAMTCLS